MPFSSKIVLSWYAKDDGMHQVVLQAIIDGQPARVPLGFCLKKEDFDVKRQRVKSKHPNAKDYDAEMQKAIAKANSIASRFRQEDKLLCPEDFRRSTLIQRKRWI